MRLGLTRFRAHAPAQAPRPGMQQIGMRTLAPAVLAGMLVGCMSAHTARLDEWGGAQNCHFAHVAREQFESALRRVFDVSRPNAYGSRPEEGGALVEQHWALDVVFRDASGSERWRLEYARAGDGIDAHADVERVEGEGASLGRNETARPAATAMYRLLWLRLAYVLGNGADWPRCETLSKPPRDSSLAPRQSPGLCGARSSDVPPPRLIASR